MKTLDGAEIRAAAAAAVLAEHRAAILVLDPKTLVVHELVRAFALATRMKNLVERRVNALRAAIDGVFAHTEPKWAPGVRLQVLEAPWGGKRLDVRPISVRRKNDAADHRTLSLAKVLALLERKEIDARRSVYVQPEPPPPPEPRFSAEKFRELVQKGRITQEEYEACLEPAQPAPSVTVDVPVEFDDAIARLLLPPSA